MSAGHPLFVAEADLTRLVSAIARAAGMTPDCADATTSALVWADMRGVGSHGVSRLPRYVEWIESGEMNPRPSPSISTRAPSMVVIDADRAPGPFAMAFATRTAVEQAKQNAISLAFVRATTHTGALGYYTDMAARAGCVAVALAASGPTMAYHGARAPGVSTSPLSISAPAGSDGPIVFDMGTGIVSVGRLAEMVQNRTAIPAGWALDRQGRPATDPATAVTPQPLGGHKGSGLAIMVEMMISLLVSNPILADALEKVPGGNRHRQNGLVIALDVQRFCAPEEFAQEVGRLRSAIKSLPPMDEDRPPLLPGERGAQAFRRSQEAGISISSRTLTALGKLASKFGVEAEWLT